MTPSENEPLSKNKFLKQAAQRIARHHRYNGQEGDEDLKVAKMLLKKTKRLADCLSLVKQA